MPPHSSRWKDASSQHVLDLRFFVLFERWDAAMDSTLDPLLAQVRCAS